jgi:hypothetical protein
VLLRPASALSLRRRFCRAQGITSYTPALTPWIYE